MIVVEIIGGLGNQMFQYALARALSVKHGVDFRMDISKFEKQNLRKFSLSRFNILENYVSEKEVNALKFQVPFLRKLYKKKAKSFIVEKSLRFDEEMLKISNGAYFEGYWQSEKYFSQIRNILLEDFELKEAMSDENQNMLDLINSKQSVSLHVRRGDYANAQNIGVHGLCSLDYYERAISYIEQKVENPHFFLFSDDPQWVSENLQINHPKTIVEINSGDDGVYDLILMKNCQHNIIANSTFSWWGAWLNQNDEKIIIAPEKWFNDESLDSQDLVPQSWVRV